MNEIKWGDLASTVGEEIVPHSTSPFTQKANKFLSGVFFKFEVCSNLSVGQTGIKKTLLEKI